MGGPIMEGKVLKSEINLLIPKIIMHL